MQAPRAPRTAEATTTFIPMPADQVDDEADIMFMGDANINIPAMSTVTLGPSFIQLPARFNGVSYFAITGHEHKLGTNVYVEVAQNAGSQGSAMCANGLFPLPVTDRSSTIRQS